jgi:hypothetical protein
VDDSDFAGFSCQCGNLYYGEYCQFKIDVCENETCSKNGFCKDFNNKPLCVCFALFFGDQCQTQSAELKTIKQTVTGASGVAITIIALFFATFISMDAFKYSTQIFIFWKSILAK